MKISMTTPDKIAEEERARNIANPDMKTWEVTLTRYRPEIARTTVKASSEAEAIEMADDCIWYNALSWHDNPNRMPISNGVQSATEVGPND